MKWPWRSSIPTPVAVLLSLPGGLSQPPTALVLEREYNLEFKPKKINTNASPSVRI